MAAHRPTTRNRTTATCERRIPSNGVRRFFIPIYSNGEITMADELITGAGDGAGAAPVADEPVAQDQAPQQTRVDLTQYPEFRQFQSAYDRQVSALQQNVQQMQQHMDEQAMAGMDDFEKVQYERDRERRDREMERNYYQSQLAQVAQQQGLNAIASEHGVPVEILDARSPEAAEASALRYKLQQLSQSKSDGLASETAERNRVDVGAGSTQGADARGRARLNQMIKNKVPAVEMYKHLLRGGT